MKKVTIYTDGACSGNPGMGGWACILEYNGKERELSGFEPQTTNNRMELLAVINGLKALKESCELEIYSDSAYVVNAFKENWIDSWVLKGWRTAGKKDVQNQDLWKQLLEIIQPHKINWIKVKGHSDNIKNNRCDELAVAQIKKNQTSGEEKRD